MTYQLVSGGCSRLPELLPDAAAPSRQGLDKRELERPGSGPVAITEGVVVRNGCHRSARRDAGCDLLAGCAQRAACDGRGCLDLMNCRYGTIAGLEEGVRWRQTREGERHVRRLRAAWTTREFPLTASVNTGGGTVLAARRSADGGRRVCGVGRPRTTGSDAGSCVTLNERQQEPSFAESEGGAWWSSCARTARIGPWAAVVGWLAVGEGGRSSRRCRVDAPRKGGDAMGGREGSAAIK